MVREVMLFRMAMNCATQATAVASAKPPSSCGSRDWVISVRTEASKRSDESAREAETAANYRRCMIVLVAASLGHRHYGQCASGPMVTAESVVTPSGAWARAPRTSTGGWVYRLSRAEKSRHAGRFQRGIPRPCRTSIARPPKYAYPQSAAPARTDRSAPLIGTAAATATRPRLATASNASLAAAAFRRDAGRIFTASPFRRSPGPGGSPSGRPTTAAAAGSASASRCVEAVRTTLPYGRRGDR